MDHLPQETITDILSRVPMKTIGSCRCVSKPWNSLLNHPQFIKAHLKKNQNQLQESLLFRSDDYHSLNSAQFNNSNHLSDEITLVANKLTFTDHLFASGEISSTASCDGLILVLDNNRGFTLINPTTKQVNVLPSFSDRFDSFPWFGIGYDSVSDDYKVVVIFSCCAGKRFDPITFMEMHVNVYSVRNGTWKGAESFVNRLDIFNGTGVYVDGHLYWVANSYMNGYFVLLEFDLHEEKFREVPRLCLFFDVKDVAHVVAIGGCFGVAVFSRKGVVDIWKLEKRGVEESWTKFPITEPENSHIRSLFFMKIEKLVLSNYVFGALENNPQLVMTDLKDNHSFKNIVVQGIPDQFSVQRTFVESLISPHCGANVARGSSLL